MLYLPNVVALQVLTEDAIEMESEIMDNYVKEQHKCGHSNLSVQKSGLIVGKFEDGFLGASLSFS